tara:strand:+ start:155 stop:487 length:333 start_codon:yes stop_codon:yes gene_type:complete
MSEERKKATLKPVAKVEPKKRVDTKAMVAVKPDVETEVKKVVETKIELNTNDTTEIKVKRAENKYIKIALDAKPEERSEFSSKVKSGEIKYAYYATDSDKGYHYYIVLKK